MFESEVQIRVRYAETDQMGYVYYGNYAAYYEVARTEVFRRLGINYKDMEATGTMMPVLELKCKYIRPAKYDDMLRIKLLLKTKPSGSRILFSYEVYNQDDTLLNVGETTMVFVDMKTGRPRTAPELIHQKMDSYFSE
ncbi:acyl-CoA thioesterase [Pontibacter sp. E15-1]|uniref:acyl-CoA thioesterase n=1 Tax=Pontibacter sp. E15-1 TaxID=2919918 RepID=UPI001F4FD0A6|nr:thioesterase family protein [Pontibacter sp. E15-1]MCJ8165868.1 acyl-CoA thioesterase [Pontibacter sp. E15-1]